MKKGLLQNKHSRSLVTVLLTLALIITTINVNSLVVNAASKPKFQKTKLQLVKGKTAKLKVKKMPKGAKIVKTKWKVQKKSVLKLTLSGSKAKKKKAKTAKIKALKTGKSAVYCTVTYRVKKSGKWKTKKNKLKATVTVVSASNKTPVPNEDKKPQTNTTAVPDGNSTSNPDGDNTPLESDNPDSDSTNPPQGSTNPDGNITNPPQDTSNPNGNSTNTPQNTTNPDDANPSPDTTTEPDDVTTSPSTSPTPTVTPTAEPLVWTGTMVRSVWDNANNKGIDGKYSQTSCSSGLTVKSDGGCWFFTITSTKWAQYNTPVLKCYRAEDDTTTDSLEVWYGTADADADNKVTYPFGEWNGKGISLDKEKVSKGIRISNYTPIGRIEICEGGTSVSHEKDIGSHDFSKTAMEFSKNLKIGWNVGNSLDSVFYNNQEGFVAGTGGLATESSANPMITENLIKAVKEAGFNTIRLPVTWTNHTDPNNNYQIDEMWMDRVEEVVQYCTGNGLYVILNVHHDGNSWLKPTTENVKEANAEKMYARYQKVWQQIAERFKDYSNLVLFASMNEFHEGYSDTNPDYFALQNKLHQIFVNTVRNTGGNNENRYLIIPGYNTNISLTTTKLILPEDSCANHLMVEVHYYDPFDFAGDEHKENQEQWGTDFSSADKSQSSGWAQEKYLISELEKMKLNYTSKGIPVIIGEMGATERYNASNEKYRLYYLQYVVQYCVQYGLIPIYWDNGYDFRLFDRNTYEVVYPDIVNGMMAALEPGYEIPIP